jgi:tetratricopeptide (TPR) repeat protein
MEAPGVMHYLAAEELIAALGQQTKFGEIEALLDELAQPSTEGPAERAWLGCLLRGANFLLVGGRYQRTEALLALIERRRGALDDAQELRLVSLEGQFALHQGNQAAGVSAFQRALALAQALGDQRCTTEMLLNVGMGLLDLGVLEEAERTLSSTLTAAERMGLDALVSCVLVNLSWVQGHLGRLADATRSAERSRALAHRHGDRRVAGASEIRLAMLDLGVDLDRAEAHARAAVDTLRPVPPVLPFALAALARVLLARGRPAEALASATEAFALFQQLGNVEDGEASVYLAYGLCLQATNDRPRAREVLTAACRRLQARAALIDRPSWRAAFLERIPDHAQTLALGAAG